MKKVLFGIIALALLFGCLGTPSFAAYPERNLDGIICWGLEEVRIIRHAL